MKPIYYVIVLLGFPLCGWGQNADIKVNFKNIEHVDDLTVSDGSIYCAGYSFRTEVYDGNACYGYLERYDSASLKLQWSICIKNNYSNKINSVIQHKDKLYALATQGNVQPRFQDVYLTLYVLNLKGEIEDTLHVGKSFSTPTHFYVSGDYLLFGYQISDGISYASKSVSAIGRYNTQTHQFETFKSDKYISRTKKIITNGANYYMCGIYLEPYLPNVLVCKNGKLSEIRLKPTKSEYFLDSYILNNRLIILCVFPGTYENKAQYLKIYSIDLANYSFTSKLITYKDLGWSAVRFDTYSTGNSTWMIVEEKESKQLYYVLVDATGKTIQRLSATNVKTHAEHFIFTPHQLINASNGNLRVSAY